MDDSRLTAAPVARNRATLAGQSALPWLLLVAALALASWALWQVYKPKPVGDPLATTLVAFEKQDRLTVFSAELAPVVASDDARLFGMLKSRQVAVIPARVDYTLDLSQMNRSRMTWDAAAKRLDVVLPPLTL